VTNLLVAETEKHGKMSVVLYKKMYFVYNMRMFHKGMRIEFEKTKG